MVAEQNSTQTYTERRFDNDCKVFQAKLLGNKMTMDWVGYSNGKKITLAVEIRMKMRSQLSLQYTGSTDMLGSAET